MPGIIGLDNALNILRAKLSSLPQDQEFINLVNARDEVLSRYGLIFNESHASAITEAEFKSFLLFENNKHWSGLHRMGSRICTDMDILRRSLIDLFDESKSIEVRLDSAVNNISGMGKAIVTAILFVAFPSKYGVWNSTSEDALVELGLWPTFQRGESFGNRYVRINEILNRLATDLGIDLWTLDSVLWFIAREETLPAPRPTTAVVSEAFGLERHLQFFLLDNWAKTSLGRDWDLFSKPGEPELGFEYRTEIGRIDLLAHHKSKPEWLVIELKRDQTSDATVGQVLRYIGWVKLHLAEKTDKVRGLIIAHAVDQSLVYAASVVPNLEINEYEVSFALKAKQMPSAG